MSEKLFYDYLILAWFGTAAAVFLILFFIVAPYGRHDRPGWGPKIRSTWGWVLMEAPSPILIALLFIIGDNKGPTAWVPALLWLGHYTYRSFIFPFLRRGGEKPMPLMIVASAVFFNLGNAYLNGRGLFTFTDGCLPLSHPLALLGLALMATGFAVHVYSDRLLINLRKPGETGYKIPQGGLYRWVSAPNYLGEIIEWTGWALLVWSPAGLTFAVWTFANLAPRALANHKWYKEKFPVYPKERKALIPGVW